MQSKAKTLSAYLAELPAENRVVIRKLDKIVRAAAPKAKVSMRFGMPTYDLGERFMAINSQRNYYSFYGTPSVVKRHRAELKGLDCGKSCIRFRKLGDVSPDLLATIAKESLEGT